jgi:thiol:disulfide interchange protein DsbA
MKNVFLLAAAMLLVACGSDDPAPADVTDDAVTETPTEETPAPVAEEPADDEVLEVVEESASDADPEEQVILLAQADTAADQAEWKYKENQHFVRLVPTQPTVGGADKIEVAEFFWYGCGHCYTFEPTINRWAADKPANVRFVRIPATWNQLVMLHAKLYYTEEVLVKNGKIAKPDEFRAAIFQEYHQRGNRMTSEESIQSVFARLGVSPDDFSNTWNSFEVAQKLRVAQDLARRYAITGVPAIVVNGKYRTGAAEAGGYPALLDVINELVERETLR